MEKQAKIYYTSDVHGYLFPTSYGDREERPMGLLNCISNFKKDGNTLVFDGGDSLQGAPLATYMASRKEAVPDMDPIAKVYNAAGYDAVVPGNHDFNFGYNRLAEYFQALQGVCLCANARDLEGKARISRSHIFVLENGLRLGVTGIVTDYVNVWEQPEHLEKIRITDAFEAASEELLQLKSQADVTVCIYHGGYECDLDNGAVLSTTGENVGCRILRELDYDILLTAHQHMSVPGKELFGTHTLQLAPNALQYACVDIKVEDGRVSVKSAICPAGGVHGKEPYESLLPLEEAVQEWLDVDIGRLIEPVPEKNKVEMALNGSAIADFFNQVQLEYSGADISCVGLGNSPISLPDHVTMRDLVRVYPFSNTLVVLEVNEKSLKKALERCAEYFALRDGEITISDAFLKPKVEHYNYDYFSGITYEMDLKEPVGNRVKRILYQGEPLAGRTLSLCMSDYRASGTGGYEVYKECRVLKRIGKEVPQLALDYFRKHPVVKIEKHGGIITVSNRNAFCITSGYESHGY
ncbi:bifunctional metallophosphatase/5'-nucleotidase [Lacrimispora saccharolytica]|uniref:5'-Nucleotidase domain protein n=1 Tax=Lacrimispora saccharolytica (strain ATCC 35040 / DSM 2544 / NRCC 2533 / WM1) TaxID=610130 RepID=D9R215_LACSW|nr:bifunctional UDP-sugar hydrolase/5'-nucleotidase [Lacrimispora saccharolytica]ADL02906.1 5'-Nucleotidase domain protein [[Clostridium] saccharolyticum WM1]QRV18897.1 bifunctional metallophosphatase/5'-nucleotidase [Lacrimispora saccharolytica]